MSKNYIERAIIMAAGTGQRLRPVTLTVPKPLVKVRGVRMIDSLISALHANGIYEIYVVIGYRKEQFYEWAKQYEEIKLIENPYFDSCNNIASLYVAREYIHNAMIMDGDQIISDSTIFHRDFTRSGYSCAWTDKETKEWLLTLNDNDIVTKCSRVGGKNGWQLFSLSRWTAEDGKKLKSHLEEEFIEKQNHGIYWDDVALFCHPEDYELGVYPIKMGDIVEIDSFEELCEADPSYRNFGVKK